MVQSDIPKAFNIGQVSYLVEDPATGDITDIMGSKLLVMKVELQ